jgi:hypothetical protein
VAGKTIAWDRRQRTYFGIAWRLSSLGALGGAAIIYNVADDNLESPTGARSSNLKARNLIKISL